MRRSTSIVFGCALIGAGFLAGRVTVGHARASQVTDPDALGQQVADVRGAIEDLRRLVERGAGAKAMLVPSGPAATAATACPSEDKAADEAKRREQQRNHPAWQDAETLVATAIDRGRWTEADVQRFREIAREASDVDLVPLMQRVDAAINSKRLRPDPDLIEFH